LIINEDVLITEYAPAMFAEVRRLDGIRPDHIMSSLNTEVNRDSIFKAKESAGKSGSFFFFSSDRKFLIKTMNNGEL
jgi:1-phosphatidylinositol-4-phosphate 5-kinase